MHPDFEQSLKAEKSEALTQLLAALALPPVTSVRFNPDKLHTGQLPSMKYDAKEVPWESNGIYLEQRPRFTFDPMLHQGVYYVQEASSMIVGEAIRRICHINGNRPMRVLDACAAPGGKTTSILSSLPEDSAVIANEYDAARAQILIENLYKWGNPSVAVTRGNTSRFKKLHGIFDIVLADMPCSGEGMFRKDPEAVAQWSVALVKQCAERQMEIAGNLIESISPGGYLIYSTCTFNTSENEHNIEKICDEFGLTTIDMGFDMFPGVTGAINSHVHASRFIPGIAKGEGLFTAILQKEGALKPASEIKSLPQKKSPVDTWVRGLVIEKTGDTYYGMTPALQALIKKIGNKIEPWLTRGVEIASIKGKDIIPTNALALSNALNHDEFVKVDIDEESAIRYLRRQSIELREEAPSGYILLCFGGRPLGFVKNLGKRNNSLLPAEWRIRN